MSNETTGKTVRFSLDLENPPLLTGEEVKQLELLEAMKDEDIDFTDIPRQTDMENWQRPGLFGGPVGALRRAALKEGFLLVESDVVEFFKADGERSAERMNRVLREYVEAQRKSMS